MSVKNYPSAEKAASELRRLYASYGYGHFKMSKFEEYDFYARNKSFLVSENVITFTSPGGRLMALKPDVTLSIVKNAGFCEGSAQKVYYNEKVYRAEDGEFCEITQTGLECIGDLSFYDIAEVVILAKRSLELIHPEHILDVTHLGFISGLLAEAGVSAQEGKELLTAVSEKNAPYIRLICDKNGVPADICEKLAALTSLYGALGEKLGELKKLSVNGETDAAAAELERLYRVLSSAGLAENVNIDFSIVNNMKYYNGFIFRGYVSASPKGLLSGGCYGNLLAKMGRRGSAAGFAIYLDRLDKLHVSHRRADADILLTYDAQTPPELVAKRVCELTSAGKRVRVAQTDDGTVLADEKLHISAKEADGNA